MQDKCEGAGIETNVVMEEVPGTTEVPRETHQSTLHHRTIHGTACSTASERFFVAPGQSSNSTFRAPHRLYRPWSGKVSDDAVAKNACPIPLAATGTMDPETGEP